MDAEALHTQGDESGQSLLEFLLMLPLLIGITVLTVRVNTAIQISIVNQRYARLHALWLAFNSPVYPELKFRQEHFIGKGYNRMVIGVSQNQAPEQGNFAPEAVEQRVTRTPAQGNDHGSPQSEENQRDIVRVRTTVTLCTQSNFAMNGQNPLELLQVLRQPASSATLTPASLAFCKSGLPDE